MTLRGAILVVLLLPLIWIGAGASDVRSEIVRPNLPSAPFVAPQAGARAVFEDLARGGEQSGRFGPTQGMLISLTWENQPAVSLTPFCPDCAQTLPEDGGPLAELYPLQVGKGIRFTRRRGDIELKDDILVTATERLTVPAGSFDTFLVRRRSETADGSWWAEQRNWYAPALGWVVKFEGKTSDGRIQSWHLLRWRAP